MSINSVAMLFSTFNWVRVLQHNFFDRCAFKKKCFIAFYRLKNWMVWKLIYVLIKFLIRLAHNASIILKIFLSLKAALHF